jgi:hypothetical protein
MQKFLCCLIKTQVCPDRGLRAQGKDQLCKSFQCACIIGGGPCSKCRCHAPTIGRYYQHGVQEMSDNSSDTQRLQQCLIQVQKSAKGEVQLQHPLTTKHALQYKCNKRAAMQRMLHQKNT